MTDADLIARFLRGEAEVVEQVRNWIRLASSPYRSKLANDLEGLEQETLMALTEACREDRFEGRSSFRTYVRAYIHHKCIDRIRTLGRRKHTDVESLGLASLEPSPLSRLEKTGEVRLALEVLSESSPACRELWRMLQSGMSYREMAQALSVAEGTLRLRVHRCRKRALDIRSRLLSRGSN